MKKAYLVTILLTLVAFSTVGCMMTGVEKPVAGGQGTVQSGEFIISPDTDLVGHAGPAILDMTGEVKITFLTDYADISFAVLPDIMFDPLYTDKDIVRFRQAFAMKEYSGQYYLYVPGNPRLYGMSPRESVKTSSGFYYGHDTQLRDHGLTVGDGFEFMGMKKMNRLDMFINPGKYITN